MLRLLTYILLVLPYFTNAQSVKWIKTYNGNNSEYPKTITTDKEGNVYTIGKFSSVIDFDPGPAEVILAPGAASGGTFITKLDKNGNLVWAKALNGNAIGQQIVLDKLGNIYFTGYFSGTVDFDPGESEYNIYYEGSNMFLCKLNNLGDFKWVKTLEGGKGSGIGYSLCIDSLFNIHTTGVFKGTINFPSSNKEVTLIGTTRFYIYIAKLDTSGEFIWAKSLQTTGASNTSNQIVSDNSGNTYTTGYFDQTTDFNPDSNVWNEESNSSSVDAFILKLEKDGKFVWVKKFGGTDYDDGCGLSLDKSNMLYATGRFKSTITFGPTTLTSKGMEDIFILKLDTDGQIIWVKAIGGVGVEQANSIHADLNGNVYLAGTFQFTVDFDPGNDVNNVTALGGYDAFICKLNSDGIFDWVRTIGSKGGWQWANCVTTDLSGSIYATGAYEDTAFYDKEQPLKNIVSGGGTDIFVIKYSPINSGIISIENSNSQFNIYPNPSNGLIYMQDLNFVYPVDLLITDAIGSKVYSTNTFSQPYLDLTFLKPGTYFITVKNSKSTFNQKFIISK